jgi:4-carboxymuconolactone decarboxylase
MKERMPALELAQMDAAQRSAAEMLINGPRKGVFGPFIALLRSPELLDRMQRVGEYLRFHNAIPARLNELAIAITAHHTSNAFEWALHVPLAEKAGVARATLDAIGRGEQPAGMPEDDALVHDFVIELLRTHFVSDARYDAAVRRFGERGVVDLVSTVGYFVAVCLVMNVAGTPGPKSAA